METVLKVIGWGLILAVCAVLGVIWVGVAVGAANAWLLHGPFDEGWRAVWATPLKALGWQLLFYRWVPGRAVRYVLDDT